MPKKKIHFMGLLANTDSSILKVNLDHGFKIKYISYKECADLIAILERISITQVTKMLSIDFPSLCHVDKIYYISKSFECEIEMDEHGSITKFPSEFDDFHKFVNDYFNTVMKLMRLFKECNIFIPLRYYYLIDNDTPRYFGRVQSRLYILPTPKYTLNNSEISDLNKFIRNIKLPFDNPFLQLAFENFDLSYITYNMNKMNLSFLTLMISLEALFNRGQAELRYTISRNTAVLLGENSRNSNNIYIIMKKLYNKRSDIVHGRDSNIINERDLLILRDFVRESIKEIYNMDKDKDDILDLLNSVGFGDRPWRMRKDANKILVKGWNNGRPNDETGAGYGIRIKRKDIDRYFKKEWTLVIIELEGEGEIEVNLSCSFWTTCEELRKKEIGKWMLNNDLAPWKKYSPPEFELEHLVDNKFRLHSMKPSRKD